jgi:hypothetical protein
MTNEKKSFILCEVCLEFRLKRFLIDNSKLKRIEQQQISFVKRKPAGRALRNFRFSIADFRLDKDTAQKP